MYKIFAYLYSQKIQIVPPRVFETSVHNAFLRKLVLSLGGIRWSQRPFLAFTAPIKSSSKVSVHTGSSAVFVLPQIIKQMDIFNYYNTIKYARRIKECSKHTYCHNIIFIYINAIFVLHIMFEAFMLEKISGKTEQPPTIPTFVLKGFKRAMQTLRCSCCFKIFKNSCI